MSHFGSFFIIGLFLQFGIGFGPLEAGAILAMQAFGAISIKIIPIKKYRIGSRSYIYIGMTGVCLMTPMILLISKKEQFFLTIMIMFLRGLLSGLVGPVLHTIAMLDLRKK